MYKYTRINNCYTLAYTYDHLKRNSEQKDKYLYTSFLIFDTIMPTLTGHLQFKII